MLAPGVRWFDDWYAVEEVSPGFFAIGEPKYHQINWNYLICGKERALLFDTGPGLRNLVPVVMSLTSLPVIAMPSHLHYDHTGNLHCFDRIAMADLQILRQCIGADGLLHAPEHLHLGSHEAMTWSPVPVAYWWPIGHVIDLGGTGLEIIATPGHSPESVSLWEPRSEILFAADFLYLDNLYAQVPGSSLPDYLDTAERLYEQLPSTAMILGAHGQADEGGLHAAPRLGLPDVEDLVAALIAIRDGLLQPVSLAPDVYKVNRRLNLLVSLEAYGVWR
jgi:glyoxylase-like metal-dependent hydrolase (beta-lactamase superfamily II)